MEIECILEKLSRICKPNIFESADVPVGQKSIWFIQLPKIFFGYVIDGRRDPAILCGRGNNKEEAIKNLWEIVRLTESGSTALVKAESSDDECFKIENQMWVIWDSTYNDWTDIDVRPAVPAKILKYDK